MQAQSSMPTASGVEHSADWYANDVLDATPGELLAIEYICCFCPRSLDTYDTLATTQDDDASQQRNTTSIWLVNEQNGPILQMSRMHPLYTELIQPSLNHDNDNNHDSLPDDMVIPYEYSAERMQQMIHTVRGDSDLQQASKVWWAGVHHL